MSSADIKQKEAPADGSNRCNELFKGWCDATDFLEILATFDSLCKEAGVEADKLQRHEADTYSSLKTQVSYFKANTLWGLLDKRANLPEYEGRTACKGAHVLIIGAGPVGLRTAIEAALLGAKVDVVEKRSVFSRNNSLHLWSFLLDDLRNLGIKVFHGKFSTGGINHICIKVLQCFLLKVCLVLGVRVHPEVQFQKIVEPKSNKSGWTVAFDPSSCPLSSVNFDVVIAAGGNQNRLSEFSFQEFRPKLALAITANFVNHNTPEDTSVPEISGVSYVYDQKFFDDLKGQHGIDLENIVYYKSETHYFVMTVKKKSVLEKKVLKKDYKDPKQLLDPSNKDQHALERYAVEAAAYATKEKLNLEFSKTHRGKNDVEIFDFTSLFQAKNSAKIIERKGKRLLLCLAGDCLLEPFWPLGTGCARGFLSGFDAAWMMKGFVSGKDPRDLLNEREAIYYLLPQTTSKNLQPNHGAYTIDPKSRYVLQKKLFAPGDVEHLYDTDSSATSPDPNVRNQAQAKDNESKENNVPVKEDKNVKAAVTHYSPPVTIKSSSNQPSLKVKDVVKALGGTVEQRAGVVEGLKGRSKTTSSPRPTPKPTVQESHESNKVKTDESQVAITRKYRWSFRSKGPKKAPSTNAAATNVSPAENQPPKEKKESWLTRTLSFRQSRRKRVRRETLEEQPTEASGQATGLNEREQKEEEKVQKRKEKAASLLPEDEIQKEEKTPPIKSKKEKAATLPLQKAENKPSLSFFQKLKKRFKKRKSYDVTKEKTAALTSGSKQEPSSGTVAQMKQQLKQKGMQTDEANSPEQSHTTKVAERKDASSPPRKVVAEAVVHTPERNGEAVGDKSKKVLKKIKTEDSKHFTLSKDDMSVMTEQNQQSEQKKESDPLWLVKKRKGLNKCLGALRSTTDEDTAKTTLVILKRIHQKIQENPKKGKHRRINVGSKGFLEDVWKFDDAKEFLRKSDWREIGDIIVLPMEEAVDEPLRVIDRHLHIVNQVIWSRSLKPTPSKRKAKGRSRLFSRRDSYTSAIVKDAKDEAEKEDAEVAKAKSSSSKGRVAVKREENGDTFNSSMHSERENELKSIEKATSEARAKWSTMEQEQQTARPTRT